MGSGTARSAHGAHCPPRLRGALTCTEGRRVQWALASQDVHPSAALLQKKRPRQPRSAHGGLTRTCVCTCTHTWGRKPGRAGGQLPCAEQKLAVVREKQRSPRVTPRGPATAHDGGGGRDPSRRTGTRASGARAGLSIGMPGLGPLLSCTLGRRVQGLLWGPQVQTHVLYAAVKVQDSVQAG